MHNGDGDYRHSSHSSKKSVRVLTNGVAVVVQWLS